MKLSNLHDNKTVLYIVHPNFVIDYLRYPDKTKELEQYFQLIRNLISNALRHNFYVVVSWLSHAFAEPDIDSQKYIKIIDGNYIYDDVEAAKIGKRSDSGEWFTWSGHKWFMISVKNKELYDQFLSDLKSIEDERYQFFIEIEKGDSVSKSVVPSLPDNTKVMVAGGHSDACVPATVRQIKKSLPRVRLLTKAIY